MGWHGTERWKTPGGMKYVNALCPPPLPGAGQLRRAGSYDERRPGCILQRQKSEFEPRARDFQYGHADPVIDSVIVVKCVKNL